MKIAFDVDGTLIVKDDKNIDTPRYTVLQLMFSLKWLGAEIFIWSGSGHDYAQRWADKLGLSTMAYVIDKNIESAQMWGIELTVDDKDCELGKLNIKV